MNLEIGTATDHYILFRDINDLTPIDFVKRYRQQDNLTGDDAAYVWAYAGRLTLGQANAVQKMLDSVFEYRFESEYKSSAHFGEIGVIEIIPHLPSALDFLVSLAPKQDCYVRLILDNDILLISSSDKDFHTQVPLNCCVRMYLRDIGEEQRILGELNSRKLQGIEDFSWSYDRITATIHKKDRSFVQLLSLSILCDTWKHIGDYSSIDILRSTATRWFKKTLCGYKFISTSKGNPDETEPIFRPSIDEQILQITARQQEVLEKCVEIVNSVRTANGGEDNNIVNKYKVTENGVPTKRKNKE
ncbi:MAG: hypothetical protein FWE67_11225 [Planctomycetaceae bacterium]|nr:hypothetical protein [Planctomycetaceae bacterium]